MANDEEPILTNPPPELASHVSDYSIFAAMLKWSAIVSVIIAFFVLLIIS